jgi:tetratricopeptide (TPR) repeat protein
MDLDRLPEARSTLQTGRRISEELGVRWRLPFYQAVLAMERFLAGEWDDALVDLEEALTLTEETGERYSLVLSHAVKALIALHRGELRQAEASVATAERELAATGPRFRSHWASWARALVLEAQGETEQAFATLADCWDQCAAFGLAVELPVFGADLVRLALAAGDRGRAKQVAAAVADVAARNDVPSIAGAARRCQGLTTDNPEVLRSAVDAYAASGRPLELAQAAEETGAALARHGQVAAATPLLQRAPDGYEHLDAARGAARVEAALRELGVRRGRRGPPPTTPPRLAQPHPDRAPGGRPGRRGPVQPPDRPAPVRVPPHGPDPPRPRLHQARHLLTRPTRRRGDPAARGAPTLPRRLMAAPAATPSTGGCLPRLVRGG